MQAHSARPANRLSTLGGRPFDLLVIGGGITGCGIARDAALRGLSVALVEKDDFASGTSSRSSRLVHGGVRYLEHGHLHLVFESSAERRRLLRLAPHLVRPLRFTWPVYEGARIPRWKLGAGLTLYDMLALFRNVGRHERLSRSEVLAREPMLSGDGLRGGASYFDASTDDARLTLANARGAIAAGAVVVNHAEATVRVEGERAVGATVRDCLDGSTVNVHATIVVRATGPWTSTVRCSKGAHIAVPRARIGNHGALTLLSPRDGRVLFTLPANEQAIIGTTETPTDASPDEVRATNDDVRYLLDSANAFFPRAALRPDDVVSAWAGIRPLLPTTGSAGSASREHAIGLGRDGVVTITGGKLTTYRIMAAQVVDVVMQRLARPRAKGGTTRLPLPGGDFESLDALTGMIVREVGDLDIAAHLARTFGSEWRAVWEEITNDGTSRLVDDLPYTVGELRYSARHELALTLGDLLIRRTHLAFETRDHAMSIAPRIAEAIAPVIGWNEAARACAVCNYASEVERIFAID